MKVGDIVIAPRVPFKRIYSEYINEYAGMTAKVTKCDGSIRLTFNNGKNWYYTSDDFKKEPIINIEELFEKIKNI